MLKIGSHVSMSGKDMLLQSVNEAISYGATTFMFYTGAPQNTARKPVSHLKVQEAKAKMLEAGIDINDVVVHAPYIINLANTIKEETFELAVRFLKEEITNFFEQQISNLLKNEEKLKKNPELINKLLKTAPEKAFEGFKEEDLKKLKTIKITPEVKEKLKENFKDRKNCLEIIEGLSVKEEKDVSDFEEEEEVAIDKNDPGIREQDDYTVPPLQNKQAPTTPNGPTPKQQGGQQTPQSNGSTTQEQEEIERKIKENQEKLEKIKEKMEKSKQKSFGPHPVGCGCGCCGGGCGCCCCKCHCCPCCCSSEISINNLKAYNDRTAAIREQNEQLRIANELKKRELAMKTAEAQAGEKVVNQYGKTIEIQTSKGAKLTISGLENIDDVSVEEADGKIIFHQQQLQQQREQNKDNSKTNILC